MKKVNLRSMSVEALLKLRDDVADVLSRKAGQLQSQLTALGDGGWIPSGKKSQYKRRVSKMKGRKVAPKYRNPKNWSEAWAGRGAQCRDGLPLKLKKEGSGNTLLSTRRQRRPKGDLQRNLGANRK